MTTTMRDTFAHTVTDTADYWHTGRTVRVRKLTVGAVDVEITPTRHGIWLETERPDDGQRVALFLMPEQAPELARMLTLAAIDSAGM